MLQKIPFPDNPRQRQILFWIYIVIIVIVSLTPADSSALPVKHIDKVGHFIAYTVMAILTLVIFEGRGKRIAIILFTFVLAFLLEWGQIFVPGRLSTLTDGITNYLGLLFGFSLYWFYHRRS